MCKTYFDLWIQVFWRFLFLNCRHIDSYRQHKTCCSWKTLAAKSPSSPKVKSGSSWCCKLPWRAKIPLGNAFTSSSGFSVPFLLALPQPPKGKFASACRCRQRSPPHALADPRGFTLARRFQGGFALPVLEQEGVGGGIVGPAKGSGGAWSRTILGVTPMEWHEPPTWVLAGKSSTDPFSRAVPWPPCP